MASWVTFLVMTGAVVLGIRMMAYLRERNVLDSAPSHGTVFGTLLAAVALGAVILTFVYNRYKQEMLLAKVKPDPNPQQAQFDVVMHSPNTSQVYVLSMGKSSILEMPPDAGLRCHSDEVIVWAGGDVWCLDKNQRLDVEDGQLQIKLRHGKPFDLNRFKNTSWVRPKPDAGVQQQSVFGAAAKTDTTKKKESIFDRYAEIIYFLALVLGVLSKFYLTWYEERKENEAFKFDPNQIVIAFILAVLVYLSVYSTIEKDKGVTTVGLLACFQNGFFFQSLLRGKVSDPTTPKPPDAPTQTAAVK